MISIAFFSFPRIFVPCPLEISALVSVFLSETTSVLDGRKHWHRLLKVNKEFIRWWSYYECFTQHLVHVSELCITKMAKEGKNIAANIGMKCISSVRAHWCRNSGKKNNLAWLLLWKWEMKATCVSNQTGHWYMFSGILYNI